MFTSPLQIKQFYAWNSCCLGWSLQISKLIAPKVLYKGASGSAGAGCFSGMGWSSNLGHEALKSRLDRHLALIVLCCNLNATGIQHDLIYVITCLQMGLLHGTIRLVATCSLRSDEKSESSRFLITQKQIRFGEGTVYKLLCLTCCDPWWPKNTIHVE